MGVRRERIDMLLVERGLAPSRTLAQALVMEGRVRAAGRRVDKPGTRVDVDSDVAVAGDPRRFASRGGLKLEAALDAFALDVTGLVALDVGASTGGFTDCLLQRGAARVYAVDVGHGQLDHALRTDPRVTVVEKVNARFLEAAHLPGAVDLVVMDVSFISATMILPALPPLMRGDDAVVLVKPQFEVGRAGVGKGGIVKSPEHWRAAILGVAEGARAAGFSARHVIVSPITGAEGNREFLLHLTVARREAIPSAGGIERSIGEALAAAILPGDGEAS
ncbi:MAG: TlyA family RNA methyltransferase [Acidobacteria bacterium]|nr:TlyA family RNA methyltransferase [Acidobacteriota bacterium]